MRGGLWADRAGQEVGEGGKEGGREGGRLAISVLEELYQCVMACGLIEQDKRWEGEGEGGREGGREGR